MGLQKQGEPARNHWTVAGRTVVFLLGASSIACLLFDFYQICPMRLFTFFVFLPAMALLIALGVLDHYQGDGKLGRAIWLGLAAGLLAAAAYDVFRLPFVFSRELGLAGLVPPLNLFKVFPRFGAMILGQPLDQDHYSALTQVVGWIYHFSNGATFGVMYIALISNPARRSWLWAVLMALALELGMLLTPYPRVFGIAVTASFIVVTIAAHGIFGVALGQTAKLLSRPPQFAPVAA